MSFFHFDENRALDMDISSFRKRVTDAIRLGSFQAGAGLELEDKDLKNNLEYEEMKRIWKKENR
ncbi:MAG: hypothetical protein J0L60_06535 [Ignavibacteria bacterium]|nr:hypothetical protein [Ignavibacteria bacterium]